MTFSDYLLDTVLVLLVVRQIRESRLDLRATLLPIGLAVGIGGSYLHGIPTAGNDLTLVLVLTALGITLGLVSALATRVRSDGGRYPLVKAGWIAGGAWVAGMGSRFAFAVWASHGGAPQLAQFSAEQHITSGAAWTAALVLMALSEVLVRTVVLVARGARLQQQRELVTA
ncbi:MAG TPA: hypothetical protein VIG48_07790 [Jatrophihabitans sp.]|jgi:hypothetical protein